MKTLINPPAQWLLWLGGLTCLGLGGLAFWNLLQLDLSYQKPLPAAVAMESPSVRQLKVPAIRRYRKMVKAPLFWEMRTVPRKPRPVRQQVVRRPEPIVVPDLEPPEGRIVGIMVGPSTYALVRTEDKNRSLRKGDKWNGWSVSDINTKRVLLVAGEQKHEMALIADFSSPTVSKKVLAERQRRKHRDKIRKRRQQQRAAASRLQQNALSEEIPSLEPAQQGPALSIQEALQARQRLIASRWSGVANRRKSNNDE